MVMEEHVGRLMAEITYDTSCVQLIVGSCIQVTVSGIIWNVPIYF